MAKRITETELILPALYVMKMHGGKVTTSILIEKLRELMKPTGEDLQILSDRNDDKFSQKVRNLRAHKTFEKYGYAQYDETARNSHVKILPKGVEHLNKNIIVLDYLLSNDFEYTDIKESLRNIENKAKKADIFDENVIVNEGVKRVAESNLYKRSSLLREYAIKHFSKNSRISCSCCNFNFEDFYGSLGRGFIEIHHAKPVFSYEDEDMNMTIRAAVDNLVPVCANCHRMIHRCRTHTIDVAELMAEVKNHGKFDRM